MRELIANNLYPTDEALRQREEMLSQGEVDKNYPVKPEAKHFQVGKHYKIHSSLHEDNPKIFEGIYKTGHEWLKIMEAFPNGREEAQIIRYVLQGQRPCKYDIYPHPFTSIDVDWRRKDLNPKQNGEFMLDRYYPDIYGLVFSCNIFKQDDPSLYRQDCKKLGDEMKRIHDKYKMFDQLQMIERAANDTLVPSNVFD